VFGEVIVFGECIVSKNKAKVGLAGLSTMAAVRMGDNTADSSIEILTNGFARLSLNDTVDESMNSLISSFAELSLKHKIRFSDIVGVTAAIPKSMYNRRPDKKSRSICKCGKCKNVVKTSVDVYKAVEMEVHPESKESVNFSTNRFKVAQREEQSYEDVIKELGDDFGCDKHALYLHELLNKATIFD
jgi:hypothetical protein